jgi:hypothetical protein
MAHPYGRVERINSMVRKSYGGYQTNDTDYLSGDDLASYMEDADDYIDFMLKRFYSIPLVMTNKESDIIKQISERYAAYAFWSDTHGANRSEEDFPPNIKRWKDEADERLKEVIRQYEEEGEYLAGETTVAKGTDQASFPRGTNEIEIRNEDILFNKFDDSNFDYQVKYGSEEVYNRITSSSTSDGYDVGSTKYTRGTDYDLDYKEGRIRRISGGSITDQQTVRVRKYIAITSPVSERAEINVDANSTVQEDYVRI